MRKNKLTIGIVAVLVLVTAVAAVLHFNSRVTTPKGTLRIETGDKVTEVSLDQLELSAVKGEVVNGKGDKKTIDGQGVALSKLLSQAGIEAYKQVSVIADDEYSAAVTAEEIAEPNRVFLLMEKDVRPKLVVFGDANSKRNVSGVIRLVVS